MGDGAEPAPDLVGAGDGRCAVVGGAIGDKPGDGSGAVVGGGMGDRAEPAPLPPKELPLDPADPDDVGSPNGAVVGCESDEPLEPDPPPDPLPADPPAPDPDAVGDVNWNAVVGCESDEPLEPDPPVDPAADPPPPAVDPVDSWVLAAVAANGMAPSVTAPSVTVIFISWLFRSNVRST